MQLAVYLFNNLHCRYETPWDNKYRPLPHWMTSSPENNDVEMALKAELAADALLRPHYDTSGSSLACSARSGVTSATTLGGAMINIPPVVNCHSGSVILNDQQHIYHQHNGAMLPPPICPPPLPHSQPFSPNTSLTRHDDSGLESI